MKNTYLNQLIANLTLKSSIENKNQQIRKLFAGAFKTLNKEKSEGFLKTIKSINKIESKIIEETNSWIEPENIKNGGKFDTMDLRHWIEIAKISNVSYIEAKEILSLTENEYSSLTGEIQVPEFIKNAFNRRLKDIDIDQTDNSNNEEDVNKAIIQNKLFDAMDDIPANWMVRSHLCGGNMLKALAGTGTIDNPDKLFNVDEKTNVGAGHVTVGNRRMIDATDDRIMKTFVSGHKPNIHFVARPWMTPGRFGECNDPHRHGTVFAGKGKWPHEWRVFIENNKVIGVSSYYPWIGEVTPENAAKALEAVSLAKKIIETTKDLNLFTKHMDTELARGKKSFPFIDERYPLDSISCTLDFMETEEKGMALLEGGPPHTPIGGAHPCGFVGGSFSPKEGCKINGVALKLPEDVILADINTWGKSQSNEICILTWEEARALASQYENQEENTLKMKL